MKGNASVALISADIIYDMQTAGYIDTNENFDDTKLQSVDEAAVFLGLVVAALEKHGVVIPPKVGAVLKALPQIEKVVVTTAPLMVDLAKALSA